MHRLRRLRLAGQQTRRGNWRCRSGDFCGAIRPDLLGTHWVASVRGLSLVLTASAHFTTKAQARSWAEGKIRALRTTAITAQAREEFALLEARWQHIDQHPVTGGDAGELLAILSETQNRPREQPLPYALVMHYRHLYHQAQQRWFMHVEQQRQQALRQLWERGWRWRRIHGQSLVAHPVRVSRHEQTWRWKIVPDERGEAVYEVDAPLLWAGRRVRLDELLLQFGRILAAEERTDAENDQG